MNLITITKTTINNQEVNSINARDLYTYLESKSKFADWIKRRLEESLAEINEDYIVLKNMTAENTAFQKIEYILTLDKAKEIAMLERNEKGKIIRKYFIEIEKRYNSIQHSLPKTYKEALIELVKAEEEKEKLLIENKTKQTTIDTQQQLLDTYDECYQTRRNKLLIKNKFIKLIKKYAYLSNQSVQSIYIQVYNTYRQLHLIPFNTKINIHYLEENIDRLVECTEIITHLLNQFIKSNDNSVDYF